MKQIFAIVGVTIGLLLFFFLLSLREISYYMKQSFYSNVVVIVSSFQYEVINEKYIPSNSMKYIMLSEITEDDINFNLNKSYIAFKKEENKTIYYLTIVGKGRYFGYTYKNVKHSEMMKLSNVKFNLWVDTNKLLKEIKASKY